MKTERQKQLDGEFYNPSDREITQLQDKSRIFMRNFNAESDKIKREKILKDWLEFVGEKCYIEPDFFCDFGCNLTLGNNVYLNTGCVILDSAKVIIGDNTMIGSNVQLCTPGHSLFPLERRNGQEFAKSISIGNDCWLGSGVIVLPGITIGEGSTIGAGSVVTKNIPPKSVAVGNPCRIIKSV